MRHACRNLGAKFFGSPPTQTRETKVPTPHDTPTQIIAIIIMPGRSSTRRRRAVKEEVEEKEEKEEEEVQDVKPSPPKRSKKPSIEEVNDNDNDDPEDDETPERAFGFSLSQQIPEASQSVLPERAAERRNLENMDRHSRDKALTTLSRLILFKALDREPIDRLKAIKDAGLANAKISTAAYQEVASRFSNVFGFELKQTPNFMRKSKTLPKRFMERYYLINTIQDNDDGSHSRAIHSIHKVSKIERGVLILTVALIFCKGESRSDGSRHLLARDLYRLMHKVDENIPEEPPAQGTARSKFTNANKHQRLQGNPSETSTPNFDCMLEHFVAADYLIREKAHEDNFLSQAVEEGDVIYSMGPRAALELGRKQIITFCAEILGEEPDPSMLKEIEGDDDEEEEEGVDALGSEQVPNA